VNRRSSKKLPSTALATVLLISVFAAMCIPASAAGNEAMILLKDSSGTDLGVQVSDLEGLGIEIIAVDEDFITASVTEEQFEQLKEEGYLVVWLKDGPLQALGAITGPVAIFQDNNPWGTTANQDTLTTNGISYTIYGSAAMGSVDLSGFDKVVIASQQPYAFYQTLSTNRGWFESYVAYGGLLEFHGASLFSDEWSALPMPAGIAIAPQNYANSDESLTIQMPTHSMVTTPNAINNDDIDNWGYSTHSYFTSTGNPPTVVITEDEFNQPVLVEFPFGKGCVIATMMTLEWWNSDQRVLENVILYDCECAPPAPLPPSVPAMTPIGIVVLMGMLGLIGAGIIMGRK
jgi:hypothetical protein